MAKFLNMDDSGPDLGTSKLGGGLKKKPKGKGPDQADRAAVAKAGQAHGFTRATGPEKGPLAARGQGTPTKVLKQPVTASRRGRPPLNEDMTYWRIYIAPQLRDELNAIRDQEGRRLNDVLADMVTAYKAKTNDL